ncbi:right-handed parallel beta-helix repeat-containing protein [Bradyrhizobium sp. WSM 1704]|uniref:NosD domain-containing protein n=1 Tax=Bradyrhizobium semiaridum TaxID=2821404 RepID=UPI001CE27F4B|nr:NosD domain-containing protein [Bradyrhizobium semiaridum]MCA6125893.1 right-handed parallel beta-helix repeat-containing protein [Bradyrhizobium semiaridum]
MRRTFSFAVILGLLTLAFAADTAYAQATRTWVSGVGDDVNPCSRTAPCKTFAGAISKTAAGGEINCIDPGGFGAVTITKSITIDCQEIPASILASATNGIYVNAGTSDKIVLRGLSINGAGTTPGIRGINILAAGTVTIENVRVFGFSQQGIADTRANGGTLAITDTVSRNNAIAGIGIATGAAVKVLISNVRLLNNGHGVATGPNAFVTIKGSDLSNNTNAGIDNEGANIVASGNAISSNGTGVLNTSSGITRLANNDIVFNTTSINNSAGSVISFGNNRTNTPTSGPITPAGGATSDLGQQ